MRVRSYDKQFIADAVDLLHRSGRPAKQVASDLGVPENTLRYWYYTHVGKPKWKRRGSQSPAVRSGEKETPEQTIARLERENAELRKRVDGLETDRAILKKAAAFFAKESE